MSLKVILKKRLFEMRGSASNWDDVAEEIGVSRQALLLWINGKAEPRYKHLVRMGLIREIDSSSDTAR